MGMPKFPALPDVGSLPPSAHPPSLANASAAAAMKSQTQTAKDSTSTASGTIATSPKGVVDKSSTARATLLGQ